MLRTQHVYNILTAFLLLWGVPAWAQISVENGVATDFLKFIQDQEQHNDLQIKFPIPLNIDTSLLEEDLKLELKTHLQNNGGWNGSGGGGGFACFKSGTKAPTFLTAQDTPAVQDFIIMDVADSVISASMPTDKNVTRMIEKNIESRIGRTLPVLAQYILHAYRKAKSLPIYSVDFLSPKKDLGPSTVGSLKSTPHCGYAQWVLRVHNTNSKLPRYELFINKSLDTHLKKILSKDMYAFQKEVLILHEAIYGLFQHSTMEEISQSTRTLVQLIVADETSYIRELRSTLPYQSSTLWSLWAQRNIITASFAVSQYIHHLEANRATSEVLEVWQDYKYFLDTIDNAPVYEFSDYTRKSFPGFVARIPRIGNPGDEQHTLYVKFFLADYIFNHKQGTQHSNRSHQANSFFLIAHQLHSLGLGLSPEAWLSDYQKNGDPFKQVCNQSKRFLSMETPQAPPMVVQIEDLYKRNLSLALSYCQRMGFYP